MYSNYYFSYERSSTHPTSNPIASDAAIAYQHYIYNKITPMKFIEQI